MRGRGGPHLRIADVARQYGISERTVYRLLDAGLPSYRVGAQHRFDEQEVRDYFRSKAAA